MAKNYFLSGAWNVTCDVCSKKIKASEAKQRWDGLIVCPEDYEQRHPQDFVKAKTDKISVPFTRPRPVDAFRLREVLSDSILVNDVDDFDNYLINNSDYFAQDYLLDLIAISILVTWNRSFVDSVSPTETLQIRTQKSFSDSVSLAETVFPRITITRTLTDSVTSTDSGSIFWENYVDSTYFASDYVGTINTF